MGVKNLMALLDREARLHELMREQLDIQKRKYLLFDASSYMFFIMEQILEIEKIRDQEIEMIRRGLEKEKNSEVDEDAADNADKGDAPDNKDVLSEEAEVTEADGADMIDNANNANLDQDVAGVLGPTQQRNVQDLGDTQSDRRYVGLYHEFEMLLFADIEKLLSYGFILEFYFDGKSSSYKEETKAIRLVEGDKKYRKLRSVVEDDVRIFDHKILPLPILTTSQFKASLQRIMLEHPDRISLINCGDEEADMYVSRVCHRYITQEGKEAYTSSNDSDFFAFNGCPLIPIGYFKSFFEQTLHRQGYVPTSELVLHTVVWTRAKVCKYFNISEELFIEFCLAVGCDYTKHISSKDLVFKGKTLEFFQESSDFNAGGYGPGGVWTNIFKLFDFLNYRKSRLTADRIVKTDQVTTAGAVDSGVNELTASSLSLNPTDQRNVNLSLKFSRAFYQIQESLDTFYEDKQLLKQYIFREGLGKLIAKLRTFQAKRIQQGSLSDSMEYSMKKTQKKLLSVLRDETDIFRSLSSEELKEIGFSKRTWRRDLGFLSSTAAVTASDSIGEDISHSEKTEEDDISSDDDIGEDDLDEDEEIEEMERMLEEETEEVVVAAVEEEADVIVSIPREIKNQIKSIAYQLRTTATLSISSSIASAASTDESTAARVPPMLGNGSRTRSIEELAIELSQIQIENNQMVQGMVEKFLPIMTSNQTGHFDEVAAAYLAVEFMASLPRTEDNYYIYRNEYEETQLIISDIHFTAFRQMIAHLQDDTLPSYYYKYLNEKISWDSMHVAIFYQKIVSYFYRYLPEWKQRFEPKLLFHGKLYHVILWYLEEKEIEDAVALEQQADEKTLLTEEEQQKAVQAAALAAQLKAMSLEGYVLPIEGKRDEIMAKVLSQTEQVTVIVGKTGSGKSTRVPVMIYEHQLAQSLPCKILVIEPRRVAAHNLWEYVSKSLPMGEVGLRLGYQQPINPNASISYATAGYVFRKYGSNLSALLEFTHILVDEVHERSIDYDLILLMMKMYLRGGGEVDVGQGGLRRKLILMSATPNLKLYEDYFSWDSLHPTQTPQTLNPRAASNLNSIDVEGSPHVITSYFIDDPSFVQKTIQFSKEFRENCHNISKFSSDAVSKGRRPANSLFKYQTKVLPSILTKFCQKGTAVLVFVSGIGEIKAIKSQFQSYVNIQVVEVHSGLDRDDDLAYLTARDPEHIRLLVATNVVESAVSISDVDTVICLGTHNVQEYDSANFSRSRLVTNWITKPSAIQRAGRTGRLRPGQVFRLYSKALFEEVFEENIVAEVHSKPLHDTIIRIIGNMSNTSQSSAADHSSDNGEEQVGDDNLIDLFQKFPEPPRSLSFFDESIQYLFDTNLLSSANPRDCKLTNIGVLASRLGLTVSLSRLIYFGMLLGVGPQAVILAAALSLPDSPFQNPVTNSKYKHPDEFNRSVQNLMKAKGRLDVSCYSEPMALLRLYLLMKKAIAEDEEYDRAHPTEKRLSPAEAIAAAAAAIVEEGDESAVEGNEQGGETDSQAPVGQQATPVRPARRQRAINKLTNEFSLHGTKALIFYNLCENYLDDLAFILEDLYFSPVVNAAVTPAEEGQDAGAYVPPRAGMRRDQFQRHCKEAFIGEYIEFTKKVLLRVILSWTSDGNILRTKQTPFLDNMITIKEHPRLTVEKLNQIFPKHTQLPYTVSTVHRYAYQGTGDISKVLFQWIEALAAVPNPFDLAWIVSSTDLHHLQANTSIPIETNHSVLLLGPTRQAQDIMEKLQSIFVGEICAIPALSDDRLTYWEVSRCIENTMKLTHLHNFFNRSFDLFLSSLSEWSCRSTNLSFPMLRESLRIVTSQYRRTATHPVDNAPIEFKSMHNLNGFLTSVYDGTGYWKIDFEPFSFNNREYGFILKDAAPGIRLLNALHCQRDKRGVAIGSYEVLHKIPRWMHGTMMPIDLKLAARQGSWELAESVVNYDDINLDGSVNWKGCNLDNRSNLSWSYFYSERATSNAAVPIYAIAGSVIESVKRTWEVAKIPKAKAGATAGENDDDEEEEEVEVINRFYRCMNVTVLPYQPHWFEVIYACIRPERPALGSISAAISTYLSQVQAIRQVLNECYRANGFENCEQLLQLVNSLHRDLTRQ